jgi:hypothetical protein
MLSSHQRPPLASTHATCKAKSSAFATLASCTRATSEPSIYKGNVILRWRRGGYCTGHFHELLPPGGLATSKQINVPQAYDLISTGSNYGVFCPIKHSEKSAGARGLRASSPLPPPGQAYQVPATPIGIPTPLPTSK